MRRRHRRAQGSGPRGAQGRGHCRAQGRGPIRTHQRLREGPVRAHGRAPSGRARSESQSPEYTGAAPRKNELAINLGCVRFRFPCLLPIIIPIDQVRSFSVLLDWWTIIRFLPKSIESIVPFLCELIRTRWLVIRFRCLLDLRLGSFF